MRISDWSSDVCASDLAPRCNPAVVWQYRLREVQRDAEPCRHPDRGPHGRTSRTRLRRDLDSPVPRSRELCPYHLQKVSRAAAGKARNPTLRRWPGLQIGRASCGERVCPSVSIPVDSGSIKKKITNIKPEGQ